MNTKTGLLALLTSSLALGCLPESKSLGGSGSDDDTTSEESCALEEQVAELLAMSTDFPDGVVDCGDLGLTDPTEAWVDARACLFAAQQSSTGVRLRHIQRSIDGAPIRVYVGLRGRTYQRYQLAHDAVGFGFPTYVRRRGCENFSPVDDCEVEPGDLCISCDAADDYEIVCTVPAD